MHWHASSKLRNESTILGCLETNLIADLDVLEKYPAILKYSAIQPVVCMQSKQHPGTLIFPCKTIDFQHIDKLTCNLHLAYCVTNWSYLLESSSIHNSFHQSPLSDYTSITNFACWLHYCFLISTDISRPVVLCFHLVKLLLISQY